MRARLSAVLSSLVLAAAMAVTAAAQSATSYRQLSWRYIGPPGNRTDAVSGVPGDPMVYYSGSASGGIFKTTDGGLHFTPIFDHEPDLSIGALAVAPSDHNVVWAGTGESFIRSHIAMGDGIYKSTDAGATWQHMGLVNTGRIRRIVIDPRNPDIVLACAMGSTYGPQPDKGVYRTTDGGHTWSKTLFVDDNTSCSDIAMDMSNPRIVYAGMWQFVEHTWGEDSGGPGSGLYKSTDGGVTWQELTGHGLPRKPFGEVSLAVAPSMPQRVYAMIETGDGFTIHGKMTQSGVLWMSNNAGASWQMMSADDGLQSRTHYYNEVEVSSDNPNEVYFLGNSFLHSLNQGVTLSRMTPPGGDNHNMWIDPTNAANMAVANDSGVSISHDRGTVWNHVSLPNAQIYHVATDDAIPYHVFGNKQDGGSYRGPSQTGGRSFGGFGRGGRGGAPRGGPIPSADWKSVGGGESGWAQPDPVDNNIVWSSGSGDGSLGGEVTRLNLHNGQVRDVEIWPDFTLGNSAAEVKYRFMWEFPLTFSPFDHNTVYAGSQYVHVTHDGGQSWQIISPDLTRNDKSKQTPSGGFTHDNIGVEYFDTIFSIAESPRQKGLIWVGTNDGLVQLSRDGGKTWNNVTAGLQGIPHYGVISNIEPSHFDAGTAYLTVDGHLVNDFNPYVYKTTDYGQTWSKITTGLPAEPNGYAHQVIEDPSRAGLLFLGTESGVYVSFNAGQQWQPLQNNLPHVPVYGLTVQTHFHDLDIATYGRGFWIMDDITPLEKAATDAAAAPALLPVRTAYEFRGPGGFGFGGGNDNTIGYNPPTGADINYLLPQRARRVRLTITNAAGQTVSTINASGAPGLNRVWWAFNGPTSQRPMVHTRPAGMPWVSLNPQGERPVPYLSPIRLSEPPGTYTVKLSVDGQPAGTPQTITVLKDPKSPATPADFAAQARLEHALFDEMNQYVGLLRQVDALRVQLRTLNVTLALTADAGNLRRQAGAVDAKLVALESHLYKSETSGQGEDEDRQPSGLGDEIDHLYQDVASADYPPTQQELDVNQLLLQKMAADRAQLAAIVKTEVAALNAALHTHGVHGLTAVTPR